MYTGGVPESVSPDPIRHPPEFIASVPVVNPDDKSILTGRFYILVAIENLAQCRARCQLRLVISPRRSEYIVRARRLSPRLVVAAPGLGGPASGSVLALWGSSIGSVESTLLRRDRPFAPLDG